MTTNENASGATEALKQNQPGSTIDRKVDQRNEFKRLLLASNTGDVDTLGDEVILPTAIAANDLMHEDFTDDEIDLPAAPVASISRYKLLTDDEVRKLPPVQWRIKGVLPSSGMAVVFGPSGSGKSFLVLDMLQSLASGREWFGRRVKPCSVTYIALEGEAGLAGRVNAYHIRHGATSPNIVYIAQPFWLLNANDINDLVLAIKTSGFGDVVVIDTLSRATPGSDENDSKAMGSIVAAAKLVQEALGGLVLMIHHTGKDPSRGMRGHSLLHAALDCAIEVRRNGDQREWIVAKSKDGEDGASHPFKLEIVPLGIDSDGDAFTSCVVVANQSVQVIQKKIPTLSSNQTIALKALEEPLRKSLDIDMVGAPQGRPEIRLDDAISLVAPLMPGLAKHQKLRAKEAVEKLVSKSLLHLNEERLTHNQYLQQ